MDAQQGGPVVKTRVCMGIAADTLARLASVIQQQAKARRNVTVTVAERLSSGG